MTATIRTKTTTVQRYTRQCYLQTSTKQTPSRYSDQGCIKYARDDRIFRSKWS